MDASPPNPFVPGRGQLPPYLAGREREQAALRNLLAYLRAGKGAPRDAVLVGPRGNGKTALLRWLCQEAETGNVDAVWLTPSEIADLDELATRLVPPRRFTSLRPDNLAFHIGIGKLGWQLGGQRGALAPLLAARCARRPLILALDECHTLDREVGHVLLNAAQTVSADAPFLLVMAGTPGLPQHLNTMSATFWSRAEKLGIGRLDEAATAAAIEKPLTAQAPSISCTASALSDVVAASQCYPYFIQLWGAALWQARGRVPIDQQTVAEAAPSVEEDQSAYYQDRFQELERSELLDVAARLANAFGGQSTLPQTTLNAAIAEALPSSSATTDVLRCRDQLTDLGYVWNPPAAADAWHPGIPSLMEYVRERVARA
ncbi:MAG: ATP-binding protein [Gammaproteobacteria bacterium]|nr:ATP-binding protein [Gammaproteobacteria bacterium]MDE0442875.1 ATP-binding protein [Gammaproteobacteria bacterium]